MYLGFEAGVARMVKRGEVAQAAQRLAGRIYPGGKGVVERQNLMAVCKAKMRQVDEAKALLQQIHLERPRDARVANNLGNVALLEDEAQTAIKLYKKAARISPWALEPRFNMCLAYSELGESEKSLYSYHEYVQIKRIIRLGKTLLVGGLLTVAVVLFYTWIMC